MYNADQCDNEERGRGRMRKRKRGKKVGRWGAEIETDPDWLEIKSHPGWLEHASSSGQI